MDEVKLLCKCDSVIKFDSYIPVAFFCIKCGRQWFCDITDHKENDFRGAWIGFRDWIK
jgi:hypothetical protein